MLFRSYRLAVIPIRIPSLRERPEDIPLLAEHFLKRAVSVMGKEIEGFDEEALKWLHQHNWPGNVRELENIVERAMILAKGGELLATHLDFGRRAQSTSNPTGPMNVITPGATAPAPTAEDGKSLAERLLDSERKEIVAAVEKSRGNIASAARILGINRSTLYYRLRKHGLEHLLPTKVGVGGDDGGEPAPA